MSAPTPWYRRLMALAELKGDHTQQEVAQALGVSKSAVTGWKQGTRPDPEQVQAAARVYGADLIELLTIAYADEDEKPKKKKNRLTPPGQDPNSPTL
jgi:transcriptional regulator with XRE-family HTH domain